MKVLSIKEPFASLIREGIKTIETRGWKTNYRGELYIHASMRTEQKYNDRKDLKKLINNIDLNSGYIICKCNLVDCVYIDEKFIKMIKNNNVEYICGEYNVGRYAWILKDIEVLSQPIKVKGKLGIWNYGDI